MIAANLPDMDVLMLHRHALDLVSARLDARRGRAARAAGGVPAVIADRPPAPRESRGPPLRAGWLLLLSYIGVYSHVFLDFLNNYGVRLLTPLDWRWFYGDALFIADIWLWLALGARHLARRRRRSGRGRPRRAGVRGVLHRSHAGVRAGGARDGERGLARGARRRHRGR